MPQGNSFPACFCKPSKPLKLLIKVKVKGKTQEGKGWKGKGERSEDWSFSLFSLALCQQAKETFRFLW
ncbi:hypothetical protein VF05_21340 [Nostoc linckia z3]|nr:hypothetical protein VF05_21340 [Nostoc linckia z3]